MNIERLAREIAAVIEDPDALRELRTHLMRIGVDAEPILLMAETSALPPPGLHARLRRWANRVTKDRVHARKLAALEAMRAEGIRTEHIHLNIVGGSWHMCVKRELSGGKKIKDSEHFVSIPLHEEDPPDGWRSAWLAATGPWSHSRGLLGLSDAALHTPPDPRSA